MLLNEPNILPWASDYMKVYVFQVEGYRLTVVKRASCQACGSSSATTETQAEAKSLHNILNQTASRQQNKL